MKLFHLWKKIIQTVFLMSALNVQARPIVICDDVADPATLDPHKEFSEKNHTIVQQIYEGLVRFTPDGKIEPALAVSWERIDLLRMRFYLREGVHFHNGESFTSEAVRFSIQRYLDPTTGFPALGFISSLDHAEVIDEYTVDILTKFPDGLLLNRLAGFILIVPPKYVIEGSNTILNEKPVGTGPFVFESWEKGKSIVLKANPNYWMKGLPKADGISFKFIPIENQIQGLLRGSVDIVTELPGTRTTEVAENKTTKVVKKDTFYTVFSCMNINQTPLRDRRVRQALNYGIDRDEIIRYDVLGNGVPIATITMKGEEGHNPNLKPYPYNPQKSKKLLSEAGFDKGLHLKVLVKEQGARTAGIIKKQLERIGVYLDMVYTNDANIVKDINSQKWDMLAGGCPDPMVHSYFIQALLFYSKSPYSITRDEKFDRSLEEIIVTLNAAERDKKAQLLDDYVYNQSLGIFIYQRIKTYGVNKRVFFNPSVTGMPHLFSIEMR